MPSVLPSAPAAKERAGAHVAGGLLRLFRAVFSVLCHAFRRLSRSLFASVLRPGAIVFLDPQISQIFSDSDAPSRTFLICGNLRNLWMSPGRRRRPDLLIAVGTPVRT